MEDKKCNAKEFRFHSFVLVLQIIACTHTHTRSKNKTEESLCIKIL